MNTPDRISRRSALRAAIAVALAPVAAIFPSKATAAGAKVVKLSALPVGGTYTFTTAAQGIPAIAFRTKTGVFAYSMICTHQGCTVSYVKSSKSLVCPCHAAKFDPLKKGRVVSGPAESPLTSIKLAIKSGWVVEA
jgi:thiosulfate dehydrogenase [quinone] large subunit